MKNQIPKSIAYLLLPVLCVLGLCATAWPRQADGDGQIPCGFGSGKFIFEGSNAEWCDTQTPNMRDWRLTRMLNGLPGKPCIDDCTYPDYCTAWVSQIVTFDYTVISATPTQGGGWWVEVNWKGIVEYDCGCSYYALVDPWYVPE